MDKSEKQAETPTEVPSLHIVSSVCSMIPSFSCLLLIYEKQETADASVIEVAAYGLPTRTPREQGNDKSEN